MRDRVLILILLAALTATAHAQFFPYPVQKKTLANGLDVIVIETPEFRDVLSFNTMILAGSGRENEKGRTGLAHLFEPFECGRDQTQKRIDHTDAVRRRREERALLALARHPHDLFFTADVRQVAFVVLNDDRHRRGVDAQLGRKARVQVIVPGERDGFAQRGTEVEGVRIVVEPGLVAEEACDGSPEVVGVPVIVGGE